MNTTKLKIVSLQMTEWLFNFSLKVQKLSVKQNISIFNVSINYVTICISTNTWPYKEHLDIKPWLIFDNIWKILEASYIVTSVFKHFKWTVIGILCNDYLSSNSLNAFINFVCNMIIFEIEVGLLQCHTGKFERLVHYFYIKMKMNWIQRTNVIIIINQTVHFQTYIYIIDQPIRLANPKTMLGISLSQLAVFLRKFDIWGIESYDFEIKL